MIAKKLRLPAINFSAPASRRAASPHLSLRAVNNQLGYNRFAVIISNRVDKRSSRRHFLKRLILDYAKNQSNRSSDFLIIASPAIKELSKEEIKSELAGLFSKT